MGCATPFLSTGKKPFTATLKTNQLLQDSPRHTLETFHFGLVSKHAHFTSPKRSKTPTSKARLIKAGFTDRIIEALYILLFKVTKSIKLSTFQFKINHHILYTRDKLFRAKIIENDECQLCGVSQTLQHLFVECRHVQSFWNLLVSWWNSCNSSR